MNQLGTFHTYLYSLPSTSFSFTIWVTPSFLKNYALPALRGGSAWRVGEDFSTWVLTGYFLSREGPYCARKVWNRLPKLLGRGSVASTFRPRGDCGLMSRNAHQTRDLTIVCQFEGQSAVCLAIFSLCQSLAVPSLPTPSILGVTLKYPSLSANYLPSCMHYSNTLSGRMSLHQSQRAKCSLKIDIYSPPPHSSADFPFATSQTSGAPFGRATSLRAAGSSTLAECLYASTPLAFLQKPEEVRVQSLMEMSGCQDPIQIYFCIRMIQNNMLVVRGRKFRKLLDQSEIERRVAELAVEVSRHYHGLVDEDSPLLVVAILNGTLVFAADLVRKMTLPLELDVCRVRSYAGSTSTGKITEILGVQTSHLNRHVLLLDDTVESGLTASRVMAAAHWQGAASLAFCSLLVRPALLKYQVDVKFTGFELGPGFTIGYGMDLQGLKRELPHIYEQVSAAV